MVVNWTDGKPDKEGYWLCAAKYNCDDHYTPYVMNVYLNNDELTVSAPALLDESMNLDIFYDSVMNGNCDFTIKYANTRIQITNINWEPKYE